MTQSRTTVVAALLLAGTVYSTGFAQAATAPTAKIAPLQVPVGHHALLTGTHLRAKSVYTALLALPNLKQKGAVKAFVGVGRTDTRGNLKIQITIPAITKCGAGSVYLYPVHAQAAVAAKIQVTRCTVSKHVIPPPPPPSGKKP